MGEPRSWGVTGHRFGRELGPVTPELRRRLDLFAARMLSQHVLPCDSPRVVSGMATGWDQAMAAAAIRAGVPFAAVLPCTDYHLPWSLQQQKRYFAILGRADDIVYVKRGSYEGPGDLFKRNRIVVDMSTSILALWSGTPRGGTAATVKLTKREGKPLINVWEDWRAFLRECVPRGEEP